MPEKFRTADLLSLGSRMRVRLLLPSATPQELLECLRHAVNQAGNAKVMTPELMATLCEHAAGNYRILMTMASEILDAAIQQEAQQLDERLYFEVFAVPARPERAGLKSGRG